MGYGLFITFINQCIYGASAYGINRSFNQVKKNLAKIEEDWHSFKCSIRMPSSKANTIQHCVNFVYLEFSKGQ